MPGRRRTSEPVALVPVPGHPRPGVLGHLTLDKQAMLERVQQVEDRAAHAVARGRENEYRSLRMQPGDPPRLVHAAPRGPFRDDDRGLPGLGRSVASSVRSR